ncbi:MAG: hypothetical protein ABSG10_09820 [Terracidiphilus sp.]|jgi:hypothetical protein
MSRYIMIRRLRGPAFLLLVGVIAILAQTDILSWGRSWPLFLILAGLLLLAERAALASEGYPPNAGGPWQGTAQRGAWQETAQSGAGAGQQATGTAMVPSQPPHEWENGGEGGQS